MTVTTYREFTDRKLIGAGMIPMLIKVRNE